MGFKEIIEKIRENKKRKKAVLTNMEEQMRAREILEDKRKSANERELERYFEEDRQKQIKEKLAFMRKKRDHDIKFNHNPLNVKNITNSTDWEVLKEKNLFKGKSNMFSGQQSILKNNPNLLKNNMRLMK